ncbi:MAG: PIG-L family deacetylase [Acidobacteriota bacterium]
MHDQPSIAFYRIVLALVVCCWSPTVAFAESLPSSSPPLGPDLPAGPESAIDPLQPASSGGLAVVDRALARLTTHRRLLMIAAHPDDEDTFALAHVVRSLDGEAAYLSLTRGDGGQNLIGTELGVGLGLLRSRELESAREVDGARQFFGRAYDFGYTRSMDETFERWPREVLLDDTLRVVRRFAPQVIVAVFPPDPRAGHGQHQASGDIAEAVYKLSRSTGDVAPELTAEGLEPWAVRGLLSSGWWRRDEDEAQIELDLGDLDLWSGRSVYQLALASRSRHRCQDMGFEQPPGEFVDALARSDESAATGPDLFSGIDTSLAAMADALVDLDLRRALAVELDGIENLARETRQRLVPSRLDDAVGPLAEIVERLDGIVRRLETPRPEGLDHGRRTVRRLVAEKLVIARDGLAAAAGLVADAIAARETIVPDETLTIRSLFWNAGEQSIEGLTVELLAESGIRATEAATTEPVRLRFPTRVSDERQFEVTLDAEVEPTVPYFLRRPRNGDLYDWTGVDAATHGLPFEPPPLRLRFRFTLDGAPMVLDREVIYRMRDQAIGEVRRPLRIVPAIEVAVDRDRIVWPIGRRDETEVTATVRSNLDRPVTVALDASMRGDGGEGWSLDGPTTVEITEPGGRRSVAWRLRAPKTAESGRFELTVRAIDPVDRIYDQSLDVIDYPHVRPVVQPVSAVAAVHAGVVELPTLDRVGYVRGASDRVPEALREIGLPIELLDARALAEADLSIYDAVIVGSRAYEVDAALVAANGRLLDYVHAGGLLIVQYQQYAFVRGGLAPLPLTIARPHGRVTDETASPRLLVPEHPIFRTPNVLEASDWQGWVQERGLYFADTWDAGYTPLLAFTDPGREEQRGALLVADWGAGRYVYTGLAFFRQMPAGVVGAYRLLANLLALADETRLNDPEIEKIGAETK